ncbi:MAG: YceI family protein [Bacteroidales bacterium]|nr:YceI family protein [Bacteroidales bacterium]
MKMNIFKLSFLLLAVAFTITQCDKSSDTTKVSGIDGIALLDNSDPADGAVVVLSSEPNASQIVNQVVAGVDGSFSFAGVDNGTYYLSARYNTENQNNLKSTGFNFTTASEIEVTVDGDDVTQNLELVSNVSTGDGVVDITDGWVYDDTHSTIEFEFPYDAFNAVFTGHFARAGFDVLSFDQANPTSTTIKAWVDVTSVETGAPSPAGGHGRDGITGCIAGSFGVDLDPADTVSNYSMDGTEYTNWPNENLVDYDLWGTGVETTTYQKQNSIIESTGVATFESTSVSVFGDGYVAVGNFSFAGETHPVNLYFHYIEGYVNNDNTKVYSSFFGWFKFAALADFGISSGHVGSSDVTVKLSAQFNKTLE